MLITSQMYSATRFRLIFALTCVGFRTRVLITERFRPTVACLLGSVHQPLPQLAIDWEDSSADASFFLERAPAHRRPPYNLIVSRSGFHRLGKFLKIIKTSRSAPPARSTLHLSDQ